MSDLQAATSQCQCQNTKSVCLCSRADIKDACEAQLCSTDGDAHPCKEERENIPIFQKKLTSQRDILLYYRGRALAEKEDLVTDREKFLAVRASWYTSTIAALNESLSNFGGPIKQTFEREIARLEEEKGWLEEDVGTKQEIESLLQELADAILEIAEEKEGPMTTLAKLPDRCVTDVSTKCTPTCKQGNQYGCHDALEGCIPDICQGDNPCPTDEMQDQAGTIGSGGRSVESICDEIIRIIDDIPEERKRQATR